MKRLSTALLALCVLFGSAALTSCGGPSAKDTAEKAVNYLVGDDIESFYDLLSTRDREAISLENFKDMYQLPEEISELEPLVPDVKVKAYKAKDFKETITGESALVTYVLILPDIDQLGRGAFSLQDVITLVKSGKVKTISDLPEEVKGKIIEYVEKNGVPTKETVQNIQLVREDDKWKVYLDIPTMLQAGKQINVFN